MVQLASSCYIQACPLLECGFRVAKGRPPATMPWRPHYFQNFGVEMLFRFVFVEDVSEDVFGMIYMEDGDWLFHFWCVATFSNKVDSTRLILGEPLPVCPACFSRGRPPAAVPWSPLTGLLH